jgi:hypothetical protein
MNQAQFVGSTARTSRRWTITGLNPFTGVSRREWRFPVLVGILALATTLPSIGVGYLGAPSGTIFTGFIENNPGDGLSYLAVMKMGAQGHWLWHDLYTSVPHPGIVVHSVYILLGHFQGLTHLPPVLVFHTARVLLGFSLVVLVYGFCSLFFSRMGPRRIAFLLAVFGGGISPLLLAAGRLGVPLSPGLDLSVAGTGVYSVLGAPPHVVIAAIGLMTVLVVAAAGDSSRPIIWLALAGVAGVFCALVYPQLPLFAACVLVPLAVWERRWWPIKVALAAVLAAAPYIGYAAYLRLTHPVVRVWIGGQGPFPVGDPLSYLLIAYTVPSLAFIAAISTRAIRFPRKAKLPLLWMMIAGIFAYAPIGVGVLMRVLFVVSVPFGILGCWGILGLGRLVAHPAVRRRLVAYGVLVAGLVSAYQAAVWIPLYLFDPSGANYVSTDMTQAMVVLEQRPQGLVMNLYSSGRFVPPYSGHTTYVGQQDETLDLADRQGDAVAFYRMDDPSRSRFMLDHNISYVVVGPEERAVADAAGNRVGDGRIFRLLFARGNVQLYERRG